MDHQIELDYPPEFFSDSNKFIHGEDTEHKRTQSAALFYLSVVPPLACVSDITFYKCMYVVRSQMYISEQDSCSRKAVGTKQNKANSKRRITYQTRTSKQQLTTNNKVDNSCVNC